VKGEWGLDEMTAIVVQHEEMMRKSKTESAHMVTHNHSECERKFYKGNKNNQNGNRGGKFDNSKPQLKHNNKDMKGKCFWCQKKGHVKKECNRFKNWLEKKGTPLALVHFESNLVDVLLNSWWIDTGASIQITNSLQGFKSKRRPNDGEVAVYLGNGEKVLVEFIGVDNLPLTSGGVLVLDDVVYVPSLRHSLISVSKLDYSGFVFHFSNKRFFFYSGSCEVASGTLCDGLYKLDLDLNYHFFS
jgi:hypothetical protein